MKRFPRRRPGLPAWPRSPRAPRPWRRKSKREIAVMREAGRIVALVHARLQETIAPGVSTWELDALAAQVMAERDAESAFLGYVPPASSDAAQPAKAYPAHTCVSINEELVHGIPCKQRKLRDGDIVSVDVGVRYQGYIGDSAWTYAVGAISPQAAHLMAVTHASLYAAIEAAQPGNRILDVSRAVQKEVEGGRLHVAYQYTGHGVGQAMHEPPQVPNYVPKDLETRRAARRKMQPGLVLALEPMVQVGTEETETLGDEWTVISADGSLTAHFEHTVAITETGPQILTQL